MSNDRHLKWLQVELVLSQHSGVAKAVVFGVPDSRLGEKIVACVSIRNNWRWVGARAEHEGEGKEVSAQILQEHCRIKNLSRLEFLITIF
jgi:acyl-activating enzyme 14